MRHDVSFRDSHDLPQRLSLESCALS
jgi:hypothetical protein